MMKETKYIDLEKFNKETLTPGAFLRLTQEQKNNIKDVVPVVKPLGSCSLRDTSFVSMRITLKNPVYKVKL